MSSVVYDRSELVGVARSLLQTVGAWFPVDAGAETPEHFVWGSGFLARCHALLSGLATLVEEGEDDSVAALYRSLLETYLSGMYVLLGGEEAVEALRAGWEHEKYQIEKILDHSVDRPEGAKRLPLSDYAGGTGLVDRVDALLEKKNPNSAGWARKAYNLHYRTTSFHDTHGGLGSLDGYMADLDDGGARVSLRPSRAAVPLRLLDMSISLMFRLGLVWADQAGKDASALAAIHDQWRQLDRPEDSASRES